MRDEAKSKEQLLTELATLRQRIAELEGSEVSHNYSGTVLADQSFELAALYETSLELNVQSDISVLLHTIVRRAAELLGTERGGLFLLQPDGETLKLVAGHNQPGPYLGQVLRRGEGLAGQIIQEGEPKFVSDYRHWDDRNTAGDFGSFGRILGVPLKRGSITIGVLNVFDDAPGTFSETAIRLLDLFAAQAAVAIEKTRLLAETQAALAQAETLYQASRSLIAIESLSGQLQAVVDSVAEALGANRIVLITVDLPAKKVIRFVTAGPGSVHVVPLSFDEMWAGLSGWVLRTSKPALSPKDKPDWRESPAVQKQRSQTACGSIGVVPVRYRNKLLGTLTAINNPDERDFVQKDIDLMMTLANQSAVALENARLFEETHRWVQQLTILNELARDMTGLLDVRELCTTVVDRVCTTFNYSDVSIFITQPATRQAVLQAITGTYTDILVPGEYQQAFGEGVIGTVAETGQRIVVNDWRTHSNFIQLEGMHVRSELAIPLKVGPKVIGVLNVESEQYNAFDQSEVDALTTVADQLAVALEKARLFEETRRRADHIEALYQVTQNLGVLRDLDTLLHQIVERAIQLLNADAGGICLHRLEQHGLEWTVAVGKTPIPIGAIFKRGEGVSGKIWATREPLIVNDYQRWPGKSSQFPDLASAIIGVPIQRRNEFIGVLTIESRSHSRHFRNKDIELLSQFATHAAIAIENSRLHQETQKQAQQFQQILDTVQDGILFLDSDHHVQLANPVAQKHLAVLAGVRLGGGITHLGTYPLSDLLVSDNHNRWQKIKSKSRSNRLFEVAVRPMAPASESEGWVIVLRDVTVEKALQERTQQQERLAAVGQLAAGIAHDFNNILTGIIGYSELIGLAPDLPETVREDLDRVIRQSQRAALLVRQILDFSRQSITEKRPIELAPFLKELYKLLERTMPENIRLVLEIEPHEEPYVIKGDPVQLQQALTNLTVNARDAMPAGGLLKLHLSAFNLKINDLSPNPEMSAGHWITLSVSDTGVGIAPDIRRHIFEPFFTTKSVGQGTGLGLAQVYGIVKQHEGFIEVESIPGNGTIFTLHFPLSLHSQALSQTTAPDVPRGQGELVLLAEDDPGVLQATEAMLLHLEYQVLTAVNGQKALEIYAEHQDRIALVLTDLTMPEAGGLALARSLTELNPDVKVIVMTGYLLEAEAEEIRSTDTVVEWLQKPLKMDQLAGAISRVLENSDKNESLSSK